jgi:hypothetical protein
MAGYVITVDFHLKPESSDKFLGLVRENAAGIDVAEVKATVGCELIVPPDLRSVRLRA